MSRLAAITIRLILGLFPAPSLAVLARASEVID
jgi:hypothetical protein